MTSADPNAPDIAVFRLTEGFVLTYGGGHSVALTNADDLAERVRVVASEVGFEVPTPEYGPTSQVVEPALSEPELPITREQIRQALTPPAMPRPQPNLSLEQQWNNARQLFAFFAAGFYPNGRAFTRTEYDAALPVVAPNLDPKEVEFELGEFLASLHDDD